MGILSDQPLLAALARGERWPRWGDRLQPAETNGDRGRSRGEMRHGCGQQGEAEVGFKNHQVESKFANSKNPLQPPPPKMSK